MWGHGQTTDTKDTDQLQFRPAAHLQFPQLRQGKAQEKKIRQHVHTGHDDPDLTRIDTLGFDNWVPDSFNRPALEDHRNDHDCGVSRYEETDGPKHAFEFAAREDTSEQ